MTEENLFEGFKPRAPRPVTEQTEAALDRTAAEHGFTARADEPAAPRRRRRKPIHTDQTAQFNLRAAVRDIDAFMDYCEERNISYREAFGEAVEKLVRR